MHVLEHSLIDSIKIIPFIFLVYLLIEYLEHKNNTFLTHKLMKSKGFGAVYGALLGSVPQCGFSVIAADLFSKGAISAGTLIAIFVATSDEAVPIILSYPHKAHFVVYVILIKIIIAIICGLLVDLIYKRWIKGEECHKEDDHHHFHGNCESCEDGIFKSALWHTIKIFIFVFVANIVLTFAIEGIGEEALSRYLLKGTAFQPFIAAAIGLIPNCAASVILTQGFLSGVVSFGSLIAGLCSGAGVGILLLLRRNKNIKESISVIGILYLIGVLSGIILQTLMG